MTDKLTVVALRMYIGALYQTFMSTIDTAADDIYKASTTRGFGLLVETLSQLKASKKDCGKFFIHNEEQLTKAMQGMSVPDVLSLFKEADIVLPEEYLEEVGDTILNNAVLKTDTLSDDCKNSLETVIDEHFGVYVAIPGKDKSQAYIDFLPTDILAAAIPPDEAMKVNEMARAFMTEITVLMEFSKTLREIPPHKEYKYEQILKKRMKKFFKLYARIKGEPVKDALKQSFGIPARILV